jgi:hypothetical protein
LYAVRLPWRRPSSGSRCRGVAERRRSLAAIVRSTPRRPGPGLGRRAAGLLQGLGHRRAPRLGRWSAAAEEAARGITRPPRVLLWLLPGERGDTPTRRRALEAGSAMTTRNAGRRRGRNMKPAPSRGAGTRGPVRLPVRGEELGEVEAWVATSMPVAERLAPGSRGRWVMRKVWYPRASDLAEGEVGAAEVLPEIGVAGLRLDRLLVRAHRLLETLAGVLEGANVVPDLRVAGVELEGALVLAARQGVVVELLVADAELVVDVAFMSPEGLAYSSAASAYRPRATWAAARRTACCPSSTRATPVRMDSGETGRAETLTTSRMRSPVDGFARSSRVSASPSARSCGAGKRGPAPSGAGGGQPGHSPRCLSSRSTAARSSALNVTRKGRGPSFFSTSTR